MRDKKWLGGALLLGLVFFLAVFMIKPIGVSTQFSVAAGIVHSTLDPSVIKADDSRSSGYASTNAYYDKSEGSLAKSIKNPVNYDFIFVLAIPLGGLLGFGSDLMQKKRKRKDVKVAAMEGIPDEPDPSEAKQPFLKTYLPAFVGGFLLLFGARMADGCTSGHMMSGMMQGSVSGYIFAAAVFFIAIPTALLIKKRTLERQVEGI